MDRLHIIGLCGFAGAGKDTAADVLVRHCRFRKIAFADALKAEIVEAFHVEPIIFQRPELKARPMAELALSRTSETAYVNAVLRHLHDQAPGQVVNSNELTRPRTPRETMQLWGTEFRRAQDLQYWTRQLVNHVRYAREKFSQAGFVIPDCRYSNEVETLRGMGGRLWQVKRPGLAAGSSHTSATDGTEFGPELVLNNEHTPKHLQQLVLGEFWAIDAGLEGLQVVLP